MVPKRYVAVIPVGYIMLSSISANLTKAQANAYIRFVKVTRNSPPKKWLVGWMKIQPSNLNPSSWCSHAVSIRYTKQLLRTGPVVENEFAILLGCRAPWAMGGNFQPRKWSDSTVLMVYEPTCLRAILMIKYMDTLW